MDRNAAFGEMRSLCADVRHERELVDEVVAMLHRLRMTMEGWKVVYDYAIDVLSRVPTRAGSSTTLAEVVEFCFEAGLVEGGAPKSMSWALAWAVVVDPSRPPVSANGVAWRFWATRPETFTGGDPWWGVKKGRGRRYEHGKLAYWSGASRWNLGKFR